MGGDFKGWLTLGWASACLWVQLGPLTFCSPIKAACCAHTWHHCCILLAFAACGLSELCGTRGLFEVSDVEIGGLFFFLNETSGGRVSNGVRCCGVAGACLLCSGSTRYDRSKYWCSTNDGRASGRPHVRLNNHLCNFKPYVSFCLRSVHPAGLTARMQVPHTSETQEIKMLSLL